MKKNNLLIKWLILSTILLGVSSCGLKEKTVDQALLENQQSIINNFKWLWLDIKLWEFKSDIKVDFKNELWEWSWKLNLDFDYDKDKILSSWDIKAIWSFSGWDDSWSIDLALSMITTKAKIYAKLNNLWINIWWEDSEESKAIMQMAQAYIWKWFHMELPKELVNQYSNNDTQVFKKFTAVMTALNKYPLLSVVKEYKNPTFYDLDVELNKDNLVKIIKEVNWKIGNWTEINEEELKKSIDNSNFSANIKINRENTDYFVFKMNKKSDLSSKIKLENSKTNIIFNATEWNNKVDIDLLKSGSKYEWTISSTSWENTELDWTLSIELWDKSISLGWFFNLSDNANLTIESKTSIKELKSVNITEPKESTDFQQAMMWIMMWGWM